jgi:hypothetical protein
MVAPRTFEVGEFVDLLTMIRQQCEVLTDGDGGTGAASNEFYLLLAGAPDGRMATVRYRATGPAMCDRVGPGRCT